MLSVVRIPFYTTFTRNSIFIKPATTTSSRVINGKVVIFKDKDNNNNLMYDKVVSIGLHFYTFLYNWVLMHVCDDVIKNTLLHFTTNNIDIMLKIIKRRKKVAKLFGVPFLCCIFVVSERDINNQIKITDMTTSTLKSATVKQIFNHISMLNPTVSEISSMGAFVSKQNQQISDDMRNELLDVVSENSLAYKILSTAKNFTDKQLWVIVFELEKNEEFGLKLAQNLDSIKRRKNAKKQSKKMLTKRFWKA